MVRPTVTGRFNAQPTASTLDGVSQSQRLAVVLGLNLALVAALVIVGVTAHSLGVLAAGADYLADAAAIAVSLFAIQLAHRPERSAAHANATNIAALVNAGSGLNPVRFDGGDISHTPGDRCPGRTTRPTGTKRADARRRSTTSAVVSSARPRQSLRPRQADPENREPRRQAVCSAGCGRRNRPQLRSTPQRDHRDGWWKRRWSF
jgi:hypothetical protein